MPLPRSDKPEWVQVTQRRQELVCLSEPTVWISHWDMVKARSRKCGGSMCQLCQMGMPKQARYILLCVDGHGKERLMELRERHADYLDRLIAEQGSTAGLRLAVVRDGSAKNSPISVRFLCRESVVKRDIALLVASFGLPALLVESQPEKVNRESFVNNSENYLDDLHEEDSSAEGCL